MKPANFPGRVNERRKRALGRTSPNAKHYIRAAERILHDAVAIGTRTKKDRTDRARFRHDGIIR